MIRYIRANTDDQLHQILAIQSHSLKENITSVEQETEGFITVPHTFEMLKTMNLGEPHCIAVDENGRVLGYALVMLRSFRNLIDILIPMFESADRLLGDKNYLVMGQICIDKPHRRKGIFQGLYRYYQRELSDQYECLFTEVATNNKRSLGAHLAIGFEILETQVTNGTSWELVNWDWNKR